MGDFATGRTVDPDEQTKRGYCAVEASVDTADGVVTVEATGVADHATVTTSSSSQLRRFAQAVAAFLADELAMPRPADANIPLADVSRRRGKEMSKWRRERRADEYSDPTKYQDPDGESSWSKSQAAELLGISKRKQKRSRSSGR